MLEFVLGVVAGAYFGVIALALIIKYHRDGKL